MRGFNLEPVQPYASDHVCGYLCKVDVMTTIVTLGQSREMRKPTESPGMDTVLLGLPDQNWCYLQFFKGAGS